MRPFHPTVREIPGLSQIEPLGSGGMAEVYRARQGRKNGRIVAVKVLKENACNGGPHCEFADRFERECQTAIALQHPHLVASYSMGKLGPRPYLVMEYVDGMSAERQVLLDGPMPVETALRILRETAGALQYMHAEGFVHRDIKPSNILLTAKGAAKLSDFGLARTSDDASITLAGGVMGTPHYLAPEQINGQHPVDVRSDIYSLGLTLYFLLVGEPPFKGPTIPAVLTRQLTDALKFPASWRSATQKRLIRLIERMTEKTPAARYANMTEVLADLAWVQGEATSPLATGVFAARRRFSKKTEQKEILAVMRELALPHDPHHLLHITAGQVLFYEDDLSDAIYWLLTGKVEVLRGGRRIAVIAQTKKVLGEMGLVKGTLRSATLRALTDCEVLRIGNHELTQFLAKNPRMMQAILADMAERIEVTSLRLMRAETSLDDIRQSLTEITGRLAKGRISSAQLQSLLLTLASDDDTSQIV